MVADHFQTIYAHHAEQYNQLVSCEDYQGNILPALQKIRPLTGLEVVEMGAGTGRLTRLLAPVVRSIRACDASRHMLGLGLAVSSLQGMGATNIQFSVGDNRCLPLPGASADVVLEGWSFGHLVGWHPEGWKAEMSMALGEMNRLLRPGGVAILLETLGTGVEKPAPPSQGLADFYSWLENECGFHTTWIRTDYHFGTIHQAEALTRFFFGEELADRVLNEKLVNMPECTGIWWKQR